MGNFTFTETKIKGVYIIDVKTYGDHRGYFMETYKESDFHEAGLDYRFVQDNQSSSRRGVPSFTSSSVSSISLQYMS